jgi:hypothetical protein
MVIVFVLINCIPFLDIKISITFIEWFKQSFYECSKIDEGKFSSFEYGSIFHFSF